MKTIKNLPLVPLDTHVMPEGRIPLTIIEARHKRMLKESYHRKHAFAICMMDEEHEEHEEQEENAFHSIATLVKVVDFENLEHNLLGLIVEGVQNVQIQKVYTEEDGLMTGDCLLMPRWEYTDLASRHQDLADQFGRFLDENPRMGELYPDARLGDAAWVAQRWLELLPFKAKDKQIVIGNECVEFCLDMISKIEMDI